MVYRREHGIPGRNDNQVKIRGYRIELGEIENQLSNYEAVKDVVVSAVGKDIKDRILVAYVAPDPAKAYPVVQLLNLERKGMLTGRQKHNLPNGMTTLCLNPNETDFMYREIFEEQTYIKHNITLEDGPSYSISGPISGYSHYM